MSDCSTKKRNPSYFELLFIFYSFVVCIYFLLLFVVFFVFLGNLVKMLKLRLRATCGQVSVQAWVELGFLSKFIGSIHSIPHLATSLNSEESSHP